MADVKLKKEIFEVEVKNHELLKLAYDAYLANSRSAGATTLKRGEVRGGGKKPWKQKGTGRARFGSSRNPIWRGGGVVWGPTGNENYAKKLSKTQKRVAVIQALSLANEDKKIYIAPAFEPKLGKVKELYAYRDELVKSGARKDLLPRGCKILFVTPEKTDLIMRATNNVPEVKVVRPVYLNVFDILNADQIVVTEKALPMIEEWLTGGEND